MKDDQVHSQVQSVPADRLPAGWQADEAWLASFCTAMEGVDAISFDVFDTAITRLTDSPVDVFAYIERELVVRFGEKARGFAYHREEGEIEARARAAVEGRHEVDLDAIYAQLAIRAPRIAKILNDARSSELAAELSLCRAVPDIREAYELAIKAGKQVVFVSDMYLPSDFVCSLLTGCGYGNAPALLISSKTGHTKSAGGMWTSLTSLAGPPERILHVGDDDWSDRHQPAAHGLRTLPFLRARSERRVGAAPDPALLAFSFAQRQAALAARQAVPETDAAMLRRTGQVLGGITVGAFLRWLEQRVVRYGIDHLYFCARDGWLLYQAWQAADLGRRTGVSASYLQVSRWPLHLARGHVEGEGQRVTPTLQRFLVPDEPGIDLRTVLQRARLLQEPGVLDAAVRAIGPLETVLATPDAFASLRNVLQAHPEPVLAMARQEYQALSAYLDQEGVGRSRRPAIVDLGWHGTVQVSLARVLQASGRTNPLTGFYYALWHHATGQRPAAGWMEAAFASDFLAPVESSPTSARRRHVGGITRRTHGHRSGLSP